jgi:hypothetical protein
MGGWGPLNKIQQGPVAPIESTIRDKDVVFQARPARATQG